MPPRFSLRSCTISPSAAARTGVPLGAPMSMARCWRCLPREFRNESFRRLESTPSTGIWTPAESRSDRSTSSGRRVDSDDFGRRNEPIERAMRAIGLTAGSGIASATSSDSGVSSSASCSWASMMASHSTQGGCGKLYSSTGRNGPNCSGRATATRSATTAPRASWWMTCRAFFGGLGRRLPGAPRRSRRLLLVKLGMARAAPFEAAVADFEWWAVLRAGYRREGQKETGG